MSERIEVTAICSECKVEHKTNIRKDLLTEAEITSGKVYYHKSYCCICSPGNTINFFKQIA